MRYEVLRYRDPASRWGLVRVARVKKYLQIASLNLPVNNEGGGRVAVQADARSIAGLTVWLTV